MSDVARAAEELGLDQWDVYGERGAVARLEANTFELFADGEADAINERAIAFMQRTRFQPCGAWRPADVPGTATCEVAVHAAAVPREPAEVATWLSGIVRG